ncbi:hypothetical protein [Glycomyces sp. NRRL B-16210]|uniref:hypothetical protein n=1 Tax=Glycomyces sp. NRRL B-16210 TaxID=1463821 RepID=UPI0004C096A1|nr:hypothetical protein [Glycomyces sp. NRRL B-16210]
MLSWTAAHEASTWLFDHAHIAGAAPDAWHLDHNAGTAALLFGCLVVGALLALLASPAPKRTSAARRRPGAPRLPLVLSIGAFIATDFAERAVAGQHGMPSFLVLLIGASVYALIGSVSSLLWHRLLDLDLRTLMAPDESPRQPAAAKTIHASRLRGFPARYWAPAVAGRAPPATAAS